MSNSKRRALLMDSEDLKKLIILRRAFEDKSSQEVIEMLAKGVSQTKTNRDFLSLINPNYKGSTSKSAD